VNYQTTVRNKTLANNICFYSIPV